MREKVIDAIRLFFKHQDFHEVETPLLVEHPGMEPFLEPFETKLQMGDLPSKRAFLLTTPEYAMKKLLVAGLPKIFQICKCFRNGEGKSGKHNPEFTIMEWYRANSDYTEIMRDCEQMFQWILKSVALAEGEESQALSYQGKTYDLSSPWERISVAEAFQKYAGIDTETLLSSSRLIEAGQKKGYTVTSQTNWEEIFNQIFLNEIESHLGQGQPTILYDYPVEMASLARAKTNDSRFAERFEFYINGIELGNAFSELADASEQEKRLLQEENLRAQIGKNVYTHDADFIEALRVGMPPSAGIAVGIDRIVMLFTDTPTIEETLFFPVGDVFEGIA